jgi:hypothetical protein
MPRFLNTEGMASLAIAICDRCKMKRALSVMSSDPNFPGLRVCNRGCKDKFDPYRLPARQTERINLRFPRPDQDISVVPDGLTTGGYDDYVISPENNTQTPSETGNLDNLSPSPGQ